MPFLSEPAPPKSGPGWCKWGTAEEVSSHSLMNRAVERLRERLSAQRIVWLEGAHLPQRIRLAEGVRGVHLAP